MLCLLKGPLMSIRPQLGRMRLVLALELRVLLALNDTSKESLRLSLCVLVQPDGWARGEREGYGGPCDVTSLSLENHCLHRF